MRERIYLADKRTLDNVKQDTQYIRNQFPLEISGGIDWSKYGNVETYNNKSISSEGIAFEIKGKGYLRDLITIADYLIDADIYIDNKKYLNVNYDSKGSSKTLYGIACISDITTETSWYRVGKAQAKYESINQFLANPIFFKNNITVKLNKGFIDELYFLGGVEK